MRFTITMLSLASLGLNVLPVQSAVVPTADLARRAEESVNHVYRSDADEKSVNHVYRSDTDEKRHIY
ncbi:hypothetical protein ETB97_012385 [Aspergillus alliaceus]|uniref:Uncharacterized protein n=1 Tax=Petromyces alliaceus TaxID=209559 RepID=A0A8H5ZSW8_PETAA|nr:hypothetical protein ETB97_012385 [Aspergillus burnettii]